MQPRLSFNFDEPENQEPVSVFQYISQLNLHLKNIKARVRGEISGFKLYSGRTYLFFSIKDTETQAMLNCFMWKRSYDMCGVDIEDGMEVIISGFTKIYEPNGSLSFQTNTIELVGEGALKKAYDQLKKKLEAEGIFALDKKRSIPDYATRIGVITSKDGAVISDFTTNIGKFGYSISFVNSRVEGQIAVPDLLNAIHTLKNPALKLDILVIMRGGGSLESFMAFNNEHVVREIAGFPVPVIAGIGHDKDISLVSLAADMMVSTPTAVAHALNSSWEQALSKVSLHEQFLFNSFNARITEKKISLEKTSQNIKNSFTQIFEKFRTMTVTFNSGVQALEFRIQALQTRVEQYANQVMHGFKRSFESLEKHIFVQEKELSLRDPELLLKRGYSIIRYNNKVLTSVKHVQIGDRVDIKTADGSLQTEVKNKQQ